MAVTLDVAPYEVLVNELTLLRDILTAERQVAAGHTKDHASVVKTLRARLSLHS